MKKSFILGVIVLCVLLLSVLIVMITKFSIPSHGNPNSSEIRDAIKAAGFSDAQTIQQGGDPYKWVIEKPKH